MGLLVAFSHPNIQHMELKPDIGLVLCEDLNAVDVAEIGQQGHQVCSGVDDVTDAVTWPHQQHHVRLFLTLLCSAEHNNSQSIYDSLIIHMDKVSSK